MIADNPKRPDGSVFLECNPQILASPHVPYILAATELSKLQGGVARVRHEELQGLPDLCALSIGQCQKGATEPLGVTQTHTGASVILLYCHNITRCRGAPMASLRAPPNRLPCMGECCP